MQQEKINMALMRGYDLYLIRIHTVKEIVATTRNGFAKLDHFLSSFKSLYDFYNYKTVEFLEN